MGSNLSRLLQRKHAFGRIHQLHRQQPELAGNPIAGSLRLQDGSLCGTLNEFFGVHASATATLLDAASSTLAGPIQVNEFGDYALLFNPNAAFVRLQCENAVPITVTIAALDPNGTDLGQTTVAGVSAPVISGMTARLRGTLLAAPVAIFLLPPTGFPSDILPRADGYLAEKGLDTRLGACQYYKSVGAVKACDAAAISSAPSPSRIGATPSGSASLP